MENNLQVFNNSEFGQIKTVTINTEIYFAGKEVAEILGYKNPQRAIHNYVNDEDKLIKYSMSSNQEDSITLINKNGLYSLISSSKSPMAKVFEKWINSKVLSFKHKKSKQTPIEIMLNVDDDGKTTAKALYEFLELDKSNFSRWCKRNILENTFAEENVDYVRFVIDDETPTGGKVKRDDYKLTASFAKKLAMSCQNERGEQAREYFLKMEKNN